MYVLSILGKCGCITVSWHRETYEHVHAFEHGLGLASSASRSFATPHDTTLPLSLSLSLSSRVRAFSIPVASALGRASMHALVCRYLKHVRRRASEKDCGEKGEHTSCRVTARSAVQASACRCCRCSRWALVRSAVCALRSACGAGTHTHRQRVFEIQNMCAVTRACIGAYGYTHQALRLSLHICMLCAICMYIIFHCLLHYIYPYRYHIYIYIYMDRCVSIYIYITCIYI